MLDDLFAQARSEQQDPSAALVGRVLADARDVLETSSLGVPPRISPEPGFAARLFDHIHAAVGWAGMAGMAMAGLVGVWIGFSQSDPAFQLIGMQVTESSGDLYLSELMTGFSTYLEEG